jgi:hypothetical protein
VIDFEPTAHIKAIAPYNILDIAPRSHPLSIAWDRSMVEDGKNYSPYIKGIVQKVKKKILKKKKTLLFLFTYFIVPALLQHSN